MKNIADERNRLMRFSPFIDVLLIYNIINAVRG